MLERVHLRLHDVIARRPATVVALALGLVLLSVPVMLMTARLDLSFRPLFTADPAAAAATADFEARFGQPSGAHIGVIVDRRDPLDGPFMVRLAHASAAVARLPHVSEVLSPASLTVSAWDGDGAHALVLAEPERLKDPVAASEAAARLREVPGPFASLMSGGGQRVLLLARLSVPLEDLQGRRAVIDPFRAATSEALPGETLHFTGVSVVEAEYAVAVLRSMARSLALTVSAVVLVLLAIFRHPGPVLISLAGVSVAAPMTLALLGLSGRPITMLGSMVPTVILIIGVADAIHMQRRWRTELRRGRSGIGSAAAIRRMYAAMALPCLLTSATTAGGFLSLGAARLDAIRGFGFAVALGVALVYLANLMLVPALLHLVGGRIALRERGTGVLTASRRLARPVLAYPRWMLALALFAAIGMGAGVARIQVDQRLNEELAATHPVRTAQALLEREFGGFMGPELEIARLDGGSMLQPRSLARIRELTDELARLGSVDRVASVLDIVPAGSTQDELRHGLLRLVADPALGPRTRELVGDEGVTLALHVRTADLGTRHSLALADTIAALAAARLGPEYRTTIVGQWWLAQRGMASLMRDMVASLLLSVLVVLPVLTLALRSQRFFLLAIGPNLLPLLAALGFMGWAGITVRIGTALVLAITLAIAVDDTIHVLARLREAERRGFGAVRAVREMVGETGGALVATTLVLVAGFLSMLSNDLAAIRDMGLVAAVALSSALLADLLVVPAMYALTRRRPARLRHRADTTTSPDGSSGPGPVAILSVSAGTRACPTARGWPNQYKPGRRS